MWFLPNVNQNFLTCKNANNGDQKNKEILSFCFSDIELDCRFYWRHLSRGAAGRQEPHWVGQLFTSTGQHIHARHGQSLKKIQGQWKYFHDHHNNFAQNCSLQMLKIWTVENWSHIFYTDQSRLFLALISLGHGGGGLCCPPPPNGKETMAMMHENNNVLKVLQWLRM